MSPVEGWFDTRGARSVKCPACGAEPGESCAYPSGAPLYNAVHFLRIVASKEDGPGPKEKGKR